MIQIDDTLISFDIFEKLFSCDLASCKGVCCIEGDSGAPLEESELQEIADNYEQIKPYMKPEGISAIETHGYGEIDSDGDLVTPLINGVECAYAIEENGSCWCAIEKAWYEGKCSFRKPISCHLYPIRITKYTEFEAVNYNKWSICKCALAKGKKEHMPVYKFLKEPLIRKYGEDWYKQLEVVAQEIEAGRIETR
ncbi:MAG: DUF3109 family protein [Marinifilaceae bacterium]